MAVEIEAKLVICVERRREFLRDFQELRRLGEAALVPRPPRSIRDRYWDTPEGDLARAGFSLRLRDDHGALSVALKGPERIREGGALERLEVEDAWSPGALGRVLDALESRGVVPRSPSEAPPSAEPSAAIAAAGFVVVHEREVARVVRDAVAPGEEVLAEIAADEVTYRIAGRRVLHGEVEIEGRGEDAGRRVDALTAELVARFGDGLRPWRASKLATARALEGLAERGELEAMLDGEGRILPDGYRRIAALAGAPPQEA